MLTLEKIRRLVIELGRYLNKYKLVIGIIIVGLILLSILGFWTYTQLAAYQPEEEKFKLAQASQEVEIIEKRSYYYINPKDKLTDIGLIYYPGGLVESSSYLYKLSKVSKDLGVKVFLTKPKFNAAIFDINAAESIIKENNLQQVILGGHSLGGISACRYVSDNTDEVDGLFIFGAYCDQDLSTRDLPVLLIMGKNDGIINKTNYSKYKTNLPADALVREINGMNHSDFGDYGLQDEDNVSKLSDEQALEIIKNNLSTLITLVDQ